MAKVKRDEGCGSGRDRQKGKGSTLKTIVKKSPTKIGAGASKEQKPKIINLDPEIIDLEPQEPKTTLILNNQTVERSRNFQKGKFSTLKTILKKSTPKIETGATASKQQKPKIINLDPEIIDLEPEEPEPKKSYPIFFIPNIIDRLAQGLDKGDLDQLRQLSNFHNHYANPAYFDRRNHIIRFYENSVHKDNAAEIKESKWDPKLAHIFREVMICNWYELIPFHVRILTDIKSFITKLSIRSLEPLVSLHSGFDQNPQSQNPIEIAVNLVELFPNLKRILVHNESKGLERELSCLLELGLRSIGSNIKVELMIEDLHFEILRKFGSRSNFLFQVQIPGMNSLDTVNTFQRISKEFGNLNNMEFFLDFRNHVTTLQKLRNVVRLSFKHKSQIKQLDLTLYLQSPNFPDRNTKGIKRSLAQLSPILTQFTLTQGAGRNRKWLNGIKHWPNLKGLELNGYKHPLFLKYCPALERLLLIVNIESSVFHKSQVSEKDQLKEYFGNLPLLKYLTLNIAHLEHSQLKSKERDLESALKELLPRKVEFCLNSYY